MEGSRHSRVGAFCVNDHGHVCEHQCGSVASRFLVNGNCGLERERQGENCCELFLDVASRPNVPQTDECRGVPWIRVHRFVWLNFLLLPYSSNRSALGRAVPVPPRTMRAESLSTDGCRSNAQASSW